MKRSSPGQKTKTRDAPAKSAKAKAPASGDLKLDDVAALKKASNEQRLDSAVDKLVEEWGEVIPALDPDVRAIAARIARIDDRLRESTASVLKSAGLSDNEFRVLAALMRIGPPHQATPSEIAGRYVPVTSGGLTGLANRLEERGLIRRQLHPRDQRSNLIALTKDGKRLGLETMKKFAEIEQAMMAGLAPEARARGNAFLRRLLQSIEDTMFKT